MSERDTTMLGEGLLLECRNVLLPWDAPLAQLLVLGSPLVEGSDLCLRWPNARILSGLPVAGVSTSAYSPGLHSLTCKPSNYATDDLEPEFSHLSRVLGSPAKVWHSGYGCVWELGRVKVELCIYDCSEFQYTESFHKWLHIEYDISSLTQKNLPPFPYDESTKRIRLPAGIESQLRRLVLTGHRAEAANIVNKLTEARLRAGTQVMQDAASCSHNGSTDTIQLPVDTENELRCLVSVGKKVEAIVRVAKFTGAGLQAAKDYVDELAEE